MVRVRFAPSPTGPLHIGGARTALFNYLIARNAGGKFLLRIDDTDLERSKTEYETDIRDSLNWLGLNWDEGPDIGGDCGPYRQTERRELHIAAANRLIENGFAYRDESEGVVRLRYPNEEVVVEDRVCGRCVFHPQSLGPEVVLLRSDGSPTYHLASVADDIDMNITHVVRGQDHLTNTAKHLLLFRGLGHPGPEFAHLPLILGEDGSKLSKRNSTGMSTVADFRNAGYLPEALLNFLLLLGWSHPEAKEQVSLEEAIRVFNITRAGKTASVFEPTKLDFLNGWWIRHISPERLGELLWPLVEEFHPELDRRGKGYWERVLSFVQGEINSLKEAVAIVAQLVSLELTFAEDKALSNPKFRADASTVAQSWVKLLKEVPVEGGDECYNAEEFSKLLASLKKLPVEKKHVFQGLRLAVIGQVSGPELGAVVPLIPREILLSRGEQAAKLLS